MACVACPLHQTCFNGLCLVLTGQGGGTNGGGTGGANGGGGGANGGGAATGGGATTGGGTATGGSGGSGGGGATGGSGGGTTGGGSGGGATGGGSGGGSGGGATGGGGVDGGLSVIVGTWNLEWFADPDGGSLGPPNNPLQQMNVQTVFGQRTDVDLWGIEEVVGTTEFSAVAANLPGFSRVLSTEVQSGTFYYGFAEQKLAVVWRTSKFTMIEARLILTFASYDFGGRPPLEVRFSTMVNGQPREFYFIVMHMKAYADMDSYNRRVAASAALKDYLDTTRAADRVMVVGDWNDDLDVSTYMQSASPYANFVSDPADYKFPTKELTDSNRRTSASSSQAIDHQMLRGTSMISGYITNSTTAGIPMIPSYTSTTSDHYPVITRHIWR